MEFKELPLKKAFEIEYFSMEDERGFFGKNYVREEYYDAGIDFSLSESFYSVSTKNVIRGLHFQFNFPQSKIVSVIDGAVWDVIVDLRESSKTFGMWTSVELSRKKHNAVFIPPQFAHGFLALEDKTVMLYQCDGKYDKFSDSGILYNDSEIGIEWPIDLKKTIHSERDMRLMSFREYKELIQKGRI